MISLMALCPRQVLRSMIGGWSRGQRSLFVKEAALEEGNTKHGKKSIQHCPEFFSLCLLWKTTTEATLIQKISNTLCQFQTDQLCLEKKTKQKQISLPGEKAVPKAKLTFLSFFLKNLYVSRCPFLHH